MDCQQQLKQIIYGLNIDLAWEYAAIIQYIQHAVMLHGPEYFEILKNWKSMLKRSVSMP